MTRRELTGHPVPGPATGIVAGGRAGHGLAAAGRADAGAFLARLVRLDPQAVVRLRPVAGPPDAPPAVALWARLPWDVLATRVIPGAAPGDATVRAGDLLDELSRAGPALPARCDARWRWPLPPSQRTVLERIPVGEILRLVEAAAGTLRGVVRDGVAGRTVGDRMARDALLDHVAIRIAVEAPAAGAPATGAPVATGPVEVPQRLVQAVARMGFLDAGGSVAGAAEVRVLRAGRWIGLAAAYGTCWLIPAAPLVLSVGR